MGQALERRFMAESIADAIIKPMGEFSANGMKDQSNTPESVGIRIKETEESDLKPLEEFLSRSEIDRLFIPPLSDPARGITIQERVRKKFDQGVWVIASREGKVVGCMAVVPSKLPTDVPSSNPEHQTPVSDGISFSGWNVDKVMELSTVVTDPQVKSALRVKGIGTELLDKAKEWTKREGKGRWGLVTDSWVGGGMGEFIDKLNTRAYLNWCSQNNREPVLDNGYFETIIRVYSDPGKRGPDGPATVVYGIPIETRDWNFFTENKAGIMRTQQVYDRLNQAQSNPA